MDADLRIGKGYIGRALMGPCARVEIKDSIAFRCSRIMGMAAENTGRTFASRIGESPAGDFRGHPHPACAQLVEHAGDVVVARIQLLQEKVNVPQERAQAQSILDYEVIELMAVNREAALAAGLPDIFLVNGDADQVRHEFGETVVVIALHPHYFDVAPGVR
jgi:hypothetical protein